MKEGSESTLGCEGSAHRGGEQIGGGTQADLERRLLTEGGAGAGATGDVQGGQDREAGEQSENEGSEGRDRAGGAWGHSSKKRRGRGRLMWSEVFNVSLLCFAENSKWGRVRAGTNEKATGRI